MDEKILEVFKKSQDRFVSGEELSKSLGVTRAAIWKHIGGLRRDGYDIEAQPHLGYRLSGIPDRLLPNEIKWKLNTKLLGNSILSYKQVDSTNTVCYNLAQKDIEEGTVVFAEGQMKGRGRMGRKWASPLYKGIYMSIILKPDITPRETPKITLVAALGVCAAIREIAGLQALIKWPNDILIENKKACGILTEISAEADKVNFLIVGIGINVNNEDGQPAGSTSLRKALGKEVSRIELAKKILENIERYYFLYKKEGFEKIIIEWRNYSATLGRRVRAIFRDSEIEGEAQDISPDGALIIRLDSGFLQEISAGDIVMLR